MIFKSDDFQTWVLLHLHIYSEGKNIGFIINTNVISIDKREYLPY